MWFMVLHAMQGTPGLERSFEVSCLAPRRRPRVSDSIVPADRPQSLSADLAQQGLLPEKHTWQGTTQATTYQDLVRDHPYVPTWGLQGIFAKGIGSMQGGAPSTRPPFLSGQFDPSLPSQD